DILGRVWIYVVLGIAVGARGPSIHSLEFTGARDGKLSGSVRLDAEQVVALRAGRLYIQIDSESAPDGNLWGWLLSE
ncbi:MAG: CHRD domain-containing protein, partial [Gammaproteobacteria bacterium]